ncbi:MAG: hypothetical protein M1828_000129 [Chrysothrix sp. TS-e1954]|nr:MAG: hypothetical protein M1828_000129 [Chrysothrix sp. TS-e1954]
MESHAIMRPTSPGVEILQPVKVQHCLTHILSPKPLLNHTFFIDSDPDDTATDSTGDLFEEPSPVVNAELLPRHNLPVRSSKRSSKRLSTKKRKALPKGDSFASNGPQMLRRSLESASDCETEDLPSSPKIVQRAAQSRDTVVTVGSFASTLRPVTAIQPAVAELDQNEVRTWSTAQVAAWLQTSGFKDEAVSKFRSNDINGPALLDLHIKDLKELDIQSVGDRHAIWNELKALRKRDGLSPVPTPSDSERSDNENAAVDDSEQGKVLRRRSSRKIRRQSQLRFALPQSSRSAKTESLRVQSYRSSKKPDASQVGVQTPAPPSIAASSDIQGPGTCPTFEFETDLLHLYARDPQEDADFIDSQKEQRAKTQQATVTPPLRPVPSPSPINESPSLDMVPRALSVSPSSLSSNRCVTQSSPVRPSRTVPFPPSPATPFYPPRSSSRHFAQKTPGASAIHLVAHSNNPSRISSPTSPKRPVLSLRAPASETDVPAISPLQPHLFERDSSQSVPPDMQYRHPVFRSQSPSLESPVSSVSPASPRPSLARTRSHSRNSNIPRRPLVLMPTVSERNTLYSNAGSAAKSPTISPLRASARTSLARASMTSRAHNMKPLPRAPHVKRTSSVLSVPRELPVSTANAYQASAIYGPGVVRAGWVRKRRNRLWRHEWQEHHFRLQGTQLAVHASAKPKDSLPHEVIDVEGYAVACSSIGRGGRLATAMKTLRIGSRETEKAYAWQLVPASSTGERNRKKTAEARHHGMGSSSSYHGPELKTHHFSVKTRDERIEWMREVMLAKAVKQRQTIRLEREKSKSSKPSSLITSPAMPSSPAPATPTLPPLTA